MLTLTAQREALESGGLSSTELVTSALGAAEGRGREANWSQTTQPTWLGKELLTEV